MCSLRRAPFPGWGANDLIDRRDPTAVRPTETKRKRVRARHVSGSTIAARLRPADALRLRGLKNSDGLSLSKFVRDAVAEKLQREFA